jgi:hypothetical protein
MPCDEPAIREKYHVSSAALLAFPPPSPSHACVLNDGALFDRFCCRNTCTSKRRCATTTIRA